MDIGSIFIKKLLTDSESSEFMDYPSLVADSDSYTSNARGD